jgi:phage gp36-like protein
MGNYVSRSDVQDRLRRSYDTLYSRDGVVDTDVVDADIAAAEAEVDGYLGQRYIVPVTASGALPLLKHWTLSLVEDLAYGAVPGRKPPENVTARVATVRAQMDKAAAGTLSLGASTVPSERTDAADCILVEGEDPVFTRTCLEGY